MSDGALNALATTGKLRVAINLGNSALVQSDAAGLGGVSPALARRLAEELAVPMQPINYAGARKVFEDADKDIWDVAFLAIDKTRAKRVSFTRPYVLIESTYAVRADSAFNAVEEADQPGRKLLVARGSAYDLYLSEFIDHAQLVRADSPGDSMNRFRDGEADMVAGVRQSLAVEFGGDPNFRILDGRIKTIEQAMVLAGPDAANLTVLDDFVRRAIADGFVRRALDESGQKYLSIPDQ